MIEQQRERGKYLIPVGGAIIGGYTGYRLPTEISKRKIAKTLAEDFYPDDPETPARKTKQARQAYYKNTMRELNKDYTPNFDIQNRTANLKKGVDYLRKVGMHEKAVADIGEGVFRLGAIPAGVLGGAALAHLVRKQVSKKPKTDPAELRKNINSARGVAQEIRGWANVAKPYLGN